MLAHLRAFSVALYRTSSHFHYSRISFTRPTSVVLPPLAGIYPLCQLEHSLPSPRHSMSFSTSPARNPDTTTGPSNPDQRGKSWGKRTRSPSPPGTFHPRSATPADNNGLEAVKKRKSSPKKARPPSPRLPSHPGQSSFQPSSQPNGQLATQSAPGGQEPPQKPEGAAAAEQKPKRTAEEKVAHALARQSAWMEANGVTDVPPGPVPTSQSDLDFGRGLFLAPMVRSGTLVNRLLALQFGADLVWSPEVVDRAIIGTKRIVDGTSIPSSRFLFSLGLRFSYCFVFACTESTTQLTGLR